MRYIVIYNEKVIQVWQLDDEVSEMYSLCHSFVTFHAFNPYC